MEENWRVVRNRSCIRAIMIFMGIILMQMLAYMVCMIVLTAGTFLFHADNAAAIEKLAQANAKDSVFLSWVSLISALLSMIWCGILYWKSDWREKNFNYRRAFCPKNILAIIGAGVGGCIVLTALLSTLAACFPQAFQSYNAVMKNLTDNGMLLSTVYVLLIGPISEELIFRGAILDRFYLAFPFWIANVLQALLFGLYHMNLIQGLYAFCLGLVLGMIRRRTGSILGCMIMHVLFNATSNALCYLFQGKQSFQLALIVVWVFGLLACAWSVRYLAHNGKANDEEPEEGKDFPVL